MANTASVDHAQLEKDVAVATGGDPAAADRVMHALRPVLDGQLRRFHLRPEDHVDVLQNALLRIQQRLADYRGESRFTTWATRVAVNEALMHLRSEKRFRARIADGPALDLDMIPASEDEEPFDGTGVRAALRGLPAAYQRVLHAFYGEEQPIATIAHELRTTEGSVRSNLLRARRLLREHFRRAGIVSFAEARVAL